MQNYANEIGILFTASAMDTQSFIDLLELNVPFIKIGSGDANNFPLLRYARSTKVPLVISTGMQNITTLNKIYSIMNENKFTNFALLHCVSSYPTKFEDVDLRFIETYKQLYPDIVIGYSGHEKGIMPSVAAVILGAKVCSLFINFFNYPGIIVFFFAFKIIERHFTLDKNQKGSDHFSSLNPVEFKKLIDIIRSVEKDKQNNTSTDNILNILKTLSQKNNLEISEELNHIEYSLANVRNRCIKDCELPCFRKLGKSCVYSKNLSRGDIISATDVCIKVSEPSGLSAEYYDSILGKTMKIDCIADSPINKCDFI